MALFHLGFSWARVLILCIVALWHGCDTLNTLTLIHLIKYTCAYNTMTLQHDFCGMGLFRQSQQGIKLMTLQTTCSNFWAISAPNSIVTLWCPLLGVWGGAQQICQRGRPRQRWRIWRGICWTSTQACNLLSFWVILFNANWGDFSNWSRSELCVCGAVTRPNCYLGTNNTIVCLYTQRKEWVGQREQNQWWKRHTSSCGNTLTKCLPQRCPRSNWSGCFSSLRNAYSHTLASWWTSMSFKNYRRRISWL